MNNRSPTLQAKTGSRKFALQRKLAEGTWLMLSFRKFGATSSFFGCVFVRGPPQKMGFLLVSLQSTVEGLRKGPIRPCAYKGVLADQLRVDVQQPRGWTQVRTIVCSNRLCFATSGPREGSVYCPVFSVGQFIPIRTGFVSR